MVSSRAILAASPGNARMQEIAKAIQEGAGAYLTKQYTAIAVVGVVVAVLVALFLGTIPAIAFVLGAVLSGVTGFIGMNISVRANVRTAEAARGSLQGGLTMAFRSGAVTGMLVAGLALLAIAGYFYALVSSGLEPTSRAVVNALVALSFGASLISIFARLGGGIFTKAADVGADMVGKNELGFDEDDDRNPGVIADNVGDNVGDCAGMAADLFETYVVTIGATMVLIALLITGADAAKLMTLPLLACGVCIITSIIGTYFVRLGGGSIMGALYKGLLVTGLLSIPALWFATAAIFPDMNAVIGADPAIVAAQGREAVTVAGVVGGFSGRELFYCMLVGLGVTALIVWITEYYTGTDYRPVQSIAKASDSGHGTNVIQGLAVSMESTALPTLVIVVGIIMTYQLAGLMGIAFAATAMLALAGMIVALDA